jgi:hypothetical protein
MMICIYIVGFCIQVETSGGDGFLVHEADEKKLLYVNICSSKVIEEPTDVKGKSFDPTTILVADGLQIPLAIGKIRNLDESSNVVDAVFHPIIIQIALQQRFFLAQVTELALQWVQQETGIIFKKQTWKDHEKKIPYMGGLGDEKITPILFQVGNVEETETGTGAGTGSTNTKKSSTQSFGSSLPIPLPKTTSSSITNQLNTNTKNTSTTGSTASTAVSGKSKTNLTTDFVLHSLRQEEQSEPSIQELNLNIPSTTHPSSTTTSAISSTNNKPATKNTISATTTTSTIKKPLIIEETSSSSSSSISSKIEENNVSTNLAEKSSINVSNRKPAAPSTATTNNTIANAITTTNPPIQSTKQSNDFLIKEHTETVKQKPTAAEVKLLEDIFSRCDEDFGSNTFNNDSYCDPFMVSGH